MKSEKFYPNNFFINGAKVTGIESINFAPAELNALEAKIYDAMEVPKSVWSGAFNLKLSKKKLKAFKRFAHVKKQRTPRKFKKQIRQILAGKPLSNYENIIARWLRFRLKKGYEKGIIQLNSPEGNV